MKTTALAILAMALTTTLCLAAPGWPEQNGLTPASGTFYVNTNFYNNGGAESGGVAINSDGNVIYGLEDDGGGVYDFEAYWSLFDFNGNLLTPFTGQTNRNISGTNGYLTAYLGLTNTYLSYFRSDGSATLANMGWGPKIKANKWGPGMGMGGSCWWTGLEVQELYVLNAMNTAGFDNDMPLVQLLNNDGTPYHPGPVSINGIGDPVNLGIVGFTTNTVFPAGSIRIADWDYLRNGNIVIVGESRQVADRALTGQTGGNVPMYRIVTPAGNEVKPNAAVSADASNNNDIWHGVGVTANGFAVKWNKALRMFDNDGNPTTTNLNLVTLTGNTNANASGDRGDNVGFHGNGTDGYIFVDRGNQALTWITTPVITTNNPGPGETYTTNFTYCCTNVVGAIPWVTVLNTNGTVRWSRSVQDSSDTWTNLTDREVDAALSPDGRAVVVFVSPLTNTTDPSVVLDTVQAKLFSPCGESLGGRFDVSDWESQTNSAFVNPRNRDITPRVAWSGARMAFSWMSWNPPFAGLGIPPVMAGRTFTVNPVAPATNLTITPSGGNVTITWSGAGTLLSGPTVTGPWTPVYQCSPYTTPASSAATHYRLVGW